MPNKKQINKKKLVYGFPTNLCFFFADPELFFLFSFFFFFLNSGRGGERERETDRQRVRERERERESLKDSQMCGLYQGQRERERSCGRTVTRGILAFCLILNLAAHKLAF